MQYIYGLTLDFSQTYLKKPAALQVAVLSAHLRSAIDKPAHRVKYAPVMYHKNLPKIICIAGPTGAGKSAAALALARRFNGVVINADSRQVYKDFPVITAQPLVAEQKLCPHRLYGFLPTPEKISAGEYVRQSRVAIEETLVTGQVPILTGGTGLYFQALLYGIANIPRIAPEIHDKWQERCTAEGSVALYLLLQKEDPEYAARIHPNDRQRITRALEVLDSTGKTFSWWHLAERKKHAEQSLEYDALYLGIGLSLIELEPGLRARIDAMLELGAIQEAEKALKNCADPKAPGWSGIGSAELYQHLVAGLELPECKRQWFSNTRAYAKRQLTWFRAQQDIIWKRPDEYTELEKLVAEKLAG